MKMNNLERENEYFLRWHLIKRKRNSGLALTIIGAFSVIIKLILLLQVLPYGILYHYDVIVYNGTMVRMYVGITMGSIAGFSLLIGLYLLILYNLQRRKL